MHRLNSHPSARKELSLRYLPHLTCSLVSLGKKDYSGIPRDEQEWKVHACKDKSEDVASKLQRPDMDASSRELVVVSEFGSLVVIGDGKRSNATFTGERVDKLICSLPKRLCCGMLPRFGRTFPKILQEWFIFINKNDQTQPQPRHYSTDSRKPKVDLRLISYALHRSAQSTLMMIPMMMITRRWS